uniref:Poly [ADP-ribose] polymerase n=1 Tax=Amphimedon queenslandica TaxID=400682 RepID=A0A1X7SX17_AMPQE
SNESYALINYETESSADRAVRHTNGKRVFGRVVRVVCKWKDNNTPIEEQYTLKVTKLSSHVTREEMEHVCCSYSDYQSLKVNEGYAYVNFSSLEGAERAMEFLKNVKFDGQCPDVKLQDRNSQQSNFQSLTCSDSRPNIPPIPPRFTPHLLLLFFLHLLSLGLPNDCRQGESDLRDYFPLCPITPVHLPPRPIPPVHLPPPPLPPFHLPPPASIHSSLPNASVPSFPEHSSLQGKSPTVKVTLGSGRITGEALEGYFSQFGKVLQTPVIISGNPDYAYVNFESSEEAKAACIPNKVELNGVQMSIKISNKSATSSTSVEKGSKLVTYEDDPLVNPITINCKFPELEGQLSNVSAKPSKDGRGILISGDKDKVEMAENIVRLHMQLLQNQIITESMNLHCKFIPLLQHPQVFQDIEQQNSVEFNVMLPNGSTKITKSIVALSSTIASAMCGFYPLTIESISDYLSSSEAGSVSWKFWDDNQQFKSMSPTDSAEIEKLYQQFLHRPPNLISHQLPCSSFNSLGLGKWKYSYDFDSMIQTNTITQTKRKIKRIPALDSLSLCLSCRGLQDSVKTSITSLHEKLEGMVIKKTFGSCSTDIAEPIIELARSFCVKVDSSLDSIVISGGSDYLAKVFLVLAQKQMSIQSSSLLTSSFPPEWEPQTENIELKFVPLSSSEAAKVVSAFRKTMNANVFKIERIQNKFLYTKYGLCKKRMHQKNNGQVNEKWLFHGSSRVPPETIYKSEHGFDFRHGNQGMWGRGAYFAVNASYSGGSYAFNSPQGRQIFLAFVLTGDSIAMQSISR